MLTGKHLATKTSPSGWGFFLGDLRLSSLSSGVCPFPLSPSLAVLLHQSERVWHREQSQAARWDQAAEAGQWGREEQGRLLGGVWRKTSNRCSNCRWAVADSCWAVAEGGGSDCILPPCGGAIQVTFLKYYSFKGHLVRFKFCSTFLNWCRQQNIATI